MVRTYDPKMVVLVVKGTPISGYADGTFIRITRNSDTFTKVVGSDGATSRAKSNDFSGTLEITLAQTSPSNLFLQALAVQDELSNTGVVPFQVKDLSGLSEYSSGLAWVRKPADVEFGKDISNRVWTMDCADLRMKTAGNLDVVSA